MLIRNLNMPKTKWGVAEQDIPKWGRNVQCTCESKFDKNNL